MSIKRDLWLTGIIAFLILVTGCGPKRHAASAIEESENSLVTYLASYNNLPKNEAGDIIRKSIENAGGWENWTSKKGLQYVKITNYLDSTGAVYRTVRQLHEYNLFPSFKARISWNENGKNFMILNNGHQAWKLEDGKVMTDEASKNSAWNSAFGSHYVMCMPFKLPDPGSQYSLEGKTTLPNGKEVDAIKVSYQEGAGSSAKYHTWWYYFDPGTYQLAANFLDFGKGYDYTEYTAFTEVDGIKLNQQRRSFASDSLRQKIRLSTTYVNEEIKFTTAFPDNYFEPSL